ncbi:uncharacterized protein LOC130797720 [Amaranthus tricolor]|uniref:uncharacterized protein LOC130797720 n=1 Tax=Amaranthus tricolor TaxID=29722 RepID=UPI0025885408|nr:uncharacterized protein LOC130797720 [Amaranthus tricolor]
MESILDTVDEELSFEDGDDVEMMDVEEGELVDRSVNSVDIHDKEVKENSHNDNPQPVKNMTKKKKRNKKKKKKNAMPKSDVVNIDRFVLNVCKRLKEPKSYLMYTAVGILGVSALGDLIKEVDAVQACGGQKTARGDRNRTGGGILWSILKSRDFNAYKEIMKKGKEFEKQFRRPVNVQPSGGSGAISSKAISSTPNCDSQTENPAADELARQPSTMQNRGSVHDRIRIPVTYDDLLGEEPPIDQSSF